MRPKTFDKLSVNINLAYCTVIALPCIAIAISIPLFLAIAYMGSNLQKRRKKSMYKTAKKNEVKRLRAKVGRAIPFSCSLKAIAKSKGKLSFIASKCKKCTVQGAKERSLKLLLRY